MSMPLYRLLRDSYIGNQLRKAGTLIRHELEPGPHMKLVPETEQPADPAPPVAPAVEPVTWPFGELSADPPASP